MPRKFVVFGSEGWLVVSEAGAVLERRPLTAFAAVRSVDIDEFMRYWGYSLSTMPESWDILDVGLRGRSSYVPAEPDWRLNVIGPPPVRARAAGSEPGA